MESCNDSDASNNDSDASNNDSDESLVMTRTRGLLTEEVRGGRCLSPVHCFGFHVSSEAGGGP